jgi:hypothetical protein
MTVEEGDSSIFTSPGELLECIDVIEVDEFGEPLNPSAAEIAAHKGDQLQQMEADES